MKVLLQGRSARSIAVNPGGDQIKLEATARVLRDRHGVDAVVSAELTPILTGFDAVQVFGLVRPQEAWVQARNARRQGVPVILSTVYCDVWDFERTARTGPVGWLARHTNRATIEALKAGGRAVRQGEWSRGSLALFLVGFDTMQRDILRLSSAILPDSNSEWRRVATDFGLNQDDPRVTVVPNGFETDGEINGLPLSEAPEHLKQYEGCVLTVARLEGRKNHPNLIEACQGLDRELVLAGQPTANQSSYVSRVHRMAEEAPNVHVLGGVSDIEKLWLYKLAAVHVLPSWMETTGLSSLEAAVGDCAIVVSPNGDTYDYFGDDAHYCDPGSPESIRTAIESAIKVGASRRLKSRIFNEFTWERSGEATFQAYQALLGR
jgi:glycosyltransferase involved in cell wall biosynthesis